MSNFTITCYGKTKKYPESHWKKMMAYYLEGMACREGSEQKRCTHIYLDLAAGLEDVQTNHNGDLGSLRTEDGRNK